MFVSIMEFTRSLRLVTYLFLGGISLYLFSKVSRIYRDDTQCFSLEEKVKESKYDKKELGERVVEGAEENKDVKKDSLENVVEKETGEKKVRERVSYRVYTKEELDSIDSRISEYKNTFESVGHRGKALEWLHRALDKARAGKEWSEIEIAIRIAKGKSGYVADAIYNAEEKIKEIYSNFIKIEGPRHMRKLLDEAMNKAKSGELWEDFEFKINIAKRYAKEAEVKLCEKEIDNIKEAYSRGIKEFGPKKAAVYLREAADILEKGESKSRVIYRIKRALTYAKEAGVNLLEE